MSDPKDDLSEEELVSRVKRWITLSEVLAPRRMRRERAPARAADTTTGRKGGEREVEREREEPR